MKYISDQGTKISLCTPDEVIKFRENRDQEKQFNLDLPLITEISQKIKRIHTIHGFMHEENCIPLLRHIEHELLFNYNFKHGYQFVIGLSCFPEHIRNSNKYQMGAINYAQMILEAFGWVVTFTKDEAWYYFNFSPLQVLSLQDVSDEIEKRINSLTLKAIDVINKGLLNRQNDFYIDNELGLTGGRYLPDNSEALLRILQKLKPMWKMHFSQDNRKIVLIPNTSP